MNPVSGEFGLGATDVSMGGGLTVSRSYDSRNLTAGEQGPFGKQWGLVMGGEESLVKQPNGSMVLVQSAGAQTIFATDGKGGFTSPTGDSNLELSSTPCESGQTEYALKNAATDTTTCFIVPSGGSGEVWVPHITKGTVATDTVIYTYETAEVETGKKITRPVQALAPVSAGVSCSPELKRGCRALEFVYGKETTAKGENASEWGEYKGLFKEVIAVMYEPVAKAMAKTAVAKYEYDKQGRLRAEWDPRISPALKTVYGYDAEGHVTALTPPGQETWAFVYGEASGDTSTGRLLKVARGTASTPLWNGVASANTEAPKLSGTMAAGETVSVSNGAWSNAPVAYSYQWEDCNSSGGECTVIPGALNASYTIKSSDVWHTLVAAVSATNGDGVTTAVSASGSIVGNMATPSYSKQSSPWTVPVEHSLKGPDGVAADGTGNVWVADTTDSQLVEFNESGEHVATVGAVGTGNGQFKSPRGIAIDSSGNIWVADTGNNRVQELNSKGEYVAQFGKAGTGNGLLKEPHGIAVGTKGEVWVADSGNYRLQKFTTTGTYVAKVGSSGSTNGHFGTTGPAGVAIDSSGNVWAADPSNNRVEEFKLVEEEFGEQYWEWTATIGTVGTGNGQLKTPDGVVFDTEGHVWVADAGNNRIQEFSASGGYLAQIGKVGAGNGEFKSPYGLTIDAKNIIWVADTSNNRAQRFNATHEYVAQTHTWTTTVEVSLKGPDGVAADGKGNVWVADTTDSQLVEFNESGEHIAIVGTSGTGNGEFKSPRGIAIDSSGNIWVADTGNSRVEELNSKGEYAAQFGKVGATNGLLKEPRGIAVGTKGEVWVADSGNYRLQKFTTAGTYVAKVGSSGSTNGHFGTTGPAGVAIDSKGNIWGSGPEQ